MYLGLIVGWAGLWEVFGRAHGRAIIVACAAVLGLPLFVVLYEEPSLRRRFGADYDEYCRNIRRWVPRLYPWYK